MCTASWAVRDNAYQLFFNRDERRSRPKADPPRIIESRGSRLIAPIDPLAGGTWIAVNDRGVCAFVLNFYAAGALEKSDSSFYRSRGEIPIAIATQEDFARSLNQLRHMDGRPYRPFYAGVIAPSEGCFAVRWNGQALETEENSIPFITTSSYRSEVVQSYRRARFEEVMRLHGGNPDPSHLFDFHRDASNQQGALNPLMSRDDAETHCVSFVAVDSNEVSIDYWERETSGGGLAGPKNVTLPRRL